MLEENLIMNMQPNSGKSRYVDQSEIISRMNDIQYAFNRLGINLPTPNVKSVATNLFKLKLK
jgi:hypothetical protein